MGIDPITLTGLALAGLAGAGASAAASSAPSATPTPTPPPTATAAPAQAPTAKPGTTQGSQPSFVGSSATPMGEMGQKTLVGQ